MNFFAKTYYYVSAESNLTGSEVANIAALISSFAWAIIIFSCVITALIIVSYWKIFEKAGKEGWKSLIPVYNAIVMLQIAGLPEWYVVLYLVPFANIFVAFSLCINLSKKFGKTTGFGVLTAFFPVICFPILAFSKNAVYEKNNIENANYTASPQPMPQQSVSQPISAQPNPTLSTQPIVQQPIQTASTAQPETTTSPINQPSYSQSMNTSKPKSNHTALIICLVIAGVLFLGITIFAIVFSELSAIDYDKSYDELIELEPELDVFTYNIEDCGRVENYVSYGLDSEDQYAKYIEGCKNELIAGFDALNKLENIDAVKRDDEVNKHYQEISNSIKQLGYTKNDIDSKLSIFSTLHKFDLRIDAVNSVEDLSPESITELANTLRQIDNQQVNDFADTWESATKDLVSAIQNYEETSSENIDAAIDTYSDALDRYFDIEDKFDTMVESLMFLPDDDTQTSIKNHISSMEEIILDKITYYE